MNTIDINLDKKKVTLKTPSSWNELTQSQFIEVVKHLPNIANGNMDNALLCLLLNIDKQLFKNLSAVQKHHLRETFIFLYQKPDISRLLVQSFIVNDVE